MSVITPSETVIRGAERRDLDRVVSVLRAANAEFERALPQRFFRAYLANVLDVRSRLEYSQLIVAEHGSRMVGTIALYPDASREGWGWPPHWTGIRAVAVEPGSRGLGIGRQLAQECIDRSRSLGAPAVCLHTGDFMDAAMVMYERLGFRRVPEFDRDAAELVESMAGEQRVAALAYRLDL